MSTGGRKKKRRSLNVRSLFSMACFFMTAGIGLIVFTTCMNSKKEIDKATADCITLEIARDEQLVEVQKLQRMIEYSKMDEYWIQQAREKLGYVQSGDIKFNFRDNE